MKTNFEVLAKEMPFVRPINSQLSRDISEGNTDSTRSTDYLDLSSDYLDLCALTLQCRNARNHQGIFGSLTPSFKARLGGQDVAISSGHNLLMIFLPSSG